MFRMKLAIGMVAVALLSTSHARGQEKIEKAPAAAPAAAVQGPVLPADGCGHLVDAGCQSQGRFFGYADYLYWRAHWSDSPFAGFLAQTTNPNLDPYSHDILGVTTSFDWDSGYRLAIGHQSCSGMEVGFTYTNFDTSGNSSLGQTAVSRGNVFANLLDRNLADETVNRDFDGGVVDFAAESIHLDYEVYDLHGGMSFRLCDGGSLLGYAGFRYADIRQSNSVAYASVDGLLLDTYTLDRQVDLKAYGLRAGTRADYSTCGFGVFANTAISLLYGQFDVSRVDIANDATGLPGIVTYRASINDIVPVLELSIGAQYQYKNILLAVGYEVTTWFGVHRFDDVPGWDDVDEETANHRLLNNALSLDGFFFRAGFSY